MFTLMVGDITSQRVDAIVNAANSSLLGGGGVDGAIHSAGGPRILAECKELRRTTLPQGLPAGEAVATTAGLLHASWVIHTVGPVFRDPSQIPVLRSCYTRSLEAAAAKGARTVAFPLVGAGVYGWPADLACQAALDGALAFVGGQDTFDEIRYVLFRAELARELREAARGLKVALAEAPVD